MRRNILMVAIILVTMACFADPRVLQGQESKTTESAREDDRQALRALLYEVRQLRLALQRSNAINHRLQITIERIHLQQGRVDSLARSLENVRNRIADLKGARPQMEEQIKYAEELMERGTEPNRRAEMEQRVKEMKGRLSIWSRDEEQLREREATLGSELQVEQSKLSDLHGQLENMLRQMEGQ